MEPGLGGPATPGSRYASGWAFGHLTRWHAWPPPALALGLAARRPRSGQLPKEDARGGQQDRRCPPMVPHPLPPPSPPTGARAPGQSDQENPRPRGLAAMTRRKHGCGTWADPAEAGKISASKSTWPDPRVTAASGHPRAGIRARRVRLGAGHLGPCCHSGSPSIRIPGSTCAAVLDESSPLPVPDTGKHALCTGRKSRKSLLLSS